MGSLKMFSLLNLSLLTGQIWEKTWSWTFFSLTTGQRMAMGGREVGGNWPVYLAAH